MICPTGEAKYFCKGGWTRLSTTRPTGKSAGLSALRAIRPAIDPAGWARQVLAMRFEILGEISKH
jgi:hypothetical protein